MAVKIWACEKRKGKGQEQRRKTGSWKKYRRNKKKIRNLNYLIVLRKNLKSIICFDITLFRLDLLNESVHGHMKFRCSMHGLNADLDGETFNSL